MVPVGLRALSGFVREIDFGVLAPIYNARLARADLTKKTG
jgi:hypothetical protein